MKSIEEVKFCCWRIESFVRSKEILEGGTILSRHEIS